MDPVGPSNNLITGLLNRELGNIGGSTLSLRSKIDELVHSHVLSDVFFAYQNDLGDSTYLITRNHDFIAYYQYLHKIVLYDLVARNKIWDCALTISQGENLDRLTVSSNGIVIALTKSPINSKCDFHIYFEGNYSGTFEIDALAFIYKVVNDVIYVLILNGVQNPATFCQWNIHGKKISEILLDEFRHPLMLHSSATSNFYFVATAVLQSETIKVLVHDLITSSTKIYDLGNSIHRIKIKSVIIHRDTVLLGITYMEMFDNGGWMYELPRNPKITEMNCLTGKIEAEHQLEHKRGHVIELVVSDDHIVFFLYEGPGTAYVWVIDRRNGKQKQILAIPDSNDGIGIDMSIFGQYLHVCYPDGDVIADNATNIHCVFDLYLSKIVKKVSYKRYAWNKMTFQDGKLVIINNKLGIRDCLYVEDFIQNDGNSEQDIVPPKMWERQVVNE